MQIECAVDFLHEDYMAIKQLFLYNFFFVELSTIAADVTVCC